MMRVTKEEFHCASERIQGMLKGMHEASNQSVSGIVILLGDTDGEAAQGRETVFTGVVKEQSELVVGIMSMFRAIADNPLINPEIDKACRQALAIFSEAFPNIHTMDATTESKQ